MIQLWMFSPPTIYIKGDINQFINPRWQPFWPLNPAQGLILNFRQALLGGPLDLRSLAISGTVSVCLAVLGCYYFRRVECNFADII